jgi:hypothetical protein
LWASSISRPKASKRLQTVIFKSSILGVHLLFAEGASHADFDSSNILGIEMKTERPPAAAAKLLALLNRYSLREQKH